VPDAVQREFVSAAAHPAKPVGLSCGFFFIYKRLGARKFGYRRQSCNHFNVKIEHFLIPISGLAHFIENTCQIAMLH
jgi:hypothetical protein